MDRAVVLERPDLLVTRASTESVRVEVLDAIRIYALPAIEQQLAHRPLVKADGTLGRHI